MNIINPERYHHLVADAQAAVFSGWDFTWLEGRMIQEDTPWDYPSLVRAALADVESLLDLGTGGGELLANLAPLPTDTHATESFSPNQAIARERLDPLNVTLHETTEEASLPFPDKRFEMVISRHESYDSQEVFRVLKPGGSFVTQQVGGLDNLELNQALEDEISYPYTAFSLANELTRLYDAGFIIELAENTALSSVFKDIGAVVYYLKAIPWQVPGFSPDSHAEGLIRLHNIIEQQGEFVATAHRFLIVAQKQKEA